MSSDVAHRRRSIRESYRKQRFPVWVGFRHPLFAVVVKLPDGALHFGIKVTRDKLQYANRPQHQYGLAFWWRRNRKGQKGEPHALTIKVFAS